MKKIIILTVSIILLAVSAAYAKESSETLRIVSENNVIELSGSKAKPAETLTVMVFKETIVSDEQWRNPSYSDRLAYVGTAVADESGIYKFQFLLTEQGRYTAIIGSDSAELIRKLDFIYADRALNEQAVTNLSVSIKNNLDTAKIASLIDTYKKELAFSSELYSAGNEAAAELIKGYMSAVSVSDSLLISELLNKAYLAAALNSGTAASIADYPYSAKLIGSSFEKYYKPDNSQAVLYITNKVKNADSIIDFDSSLKEALILSVITYVCDTELIRTALVEFEQDIGISKAQVTDSLCRSVNGKSFNGFSDLKYYIDNFKSDTAGNGGKGEDGYVSPRTASASANLSGKTFENNVVNVEKNENTVFSDIGNVEWAREAIEGLYFKGIISGKTETSFFPDDQILREEFVKLIVEALRLNITGDSISFDDVSEDKWYFPYIKRAYNSEIIKGESEQFFGIGKSITRQDLAVMVNNACIMCDVTLPKVKEKEEFSDESLISGYAVDAVNALQQSGIINGYDGRFNPLGYATRAEAAKIIYMVLACLN